MHESDVELGFLWILTNHKMVYGDENDDGGVSGGTGATAAAEGSERE